MEWEGPGFRREPLPARLLRHDAASTTSLDGRRLFEDLGCSNCHVSDSPSIQKRPAPILTGLGGRVKPRWIRHWLDAPERFRSWATMPQMLRDSDRADVAAFLAAQSASPIDEPEDRKSHQERGRTTFQSFGCVACHGSDLPLAGLGSKMTVGRLQRYLLDPLRFSPDGRMPSFHLNSQESLELAAFLALSRDESFEVPVAAGDTQRGRELVRTKGCLACHQLQGLESASLAPQLLSLDASRGCLAQRVPQGLPRYRLSDGQREALRSFVLAYRAVPDRVRAPTFDLPRRLRQLRCGACHEVEGAAPTGFLAEAAPSLNDVGEKLTSAWIERIIRVDAGVLAWQELRMPSFGPSHARWLSDALAKAAGVDPAEPAALGDAASGQKGIDRLGMNGARGGMGCIGCHGWGEFLSLGENGPSLSGTGRRLRWPWFKRWMHDPARILPGTSMPNYFGGIETAETLAALTEFWAAFRGADRLPAPFGFSAADAKLGAESQPEPRDRTIVLRLGHARGHAGGDRRRLAGRNLVLFRRRRVSAAVRVARRVRRYVPNSARQEEPGDEPDRDRRNRRRDLLPRGSVSDSRGRSCPHPATNASWVTV